MFVYCLLMSSFMLLVVWIHVNAFKDISTIHVRFLPTSNFVDGAFRQSFPAFEIYRAKSTSHRRQQDPQTLSDERVRKLYVEFSGSFAVKAMFRTSLVFTSIFQLFQRKNELQRVRKRFREEPATASLGQLRSSECQHPCQYERRQLTRSRKQLRSLVADGAVLLRPWQGEAPAANSPRLCFQTAAQRSTFLRALQRRRPSQIWPVSENDS